MREENEISELNLAMEGFFKQFIKNGNNFNYDIHYDSTDFSEYDAVIIQKDAKTKNTIKKLLFNAFINTNHYEAILLEYKKFSLLKELVSSDDDKIYYIMFTPKGTIIYDLLKLEKDNLINFIENENNEKQNALIDLSDGKFFNYIFTPKSDKPLEKQETNDIQREIVFDPSDYDLPVKRDEKGDIYFDGLNDMQRYPESIIWEYVHQERIKTSLLPHENKEEMLKEHGGVVKLGEFLAKRNMENTMDYIKKSIYDKREKFLKRFRNG